MGDNRRAMGGTEMEADGAGTPPLGATVHDGGTTFRVWAPHAEAVCLAGTVNGWAPEATPLVREGGGCWSTWVAGVGPGAEYKYVIDHGGERLWRVDPYARAVSGPHDNGVVVAPVRPAVRFAMPRRNELVIYELHVGTFHDEPGGPPGDFRTAAERLDHLQQLGVNAVEVMPQAEFAGSFSWGYNPGHIFAVERAYGGRDGFRAFVEAAHGHGIAVLLDVVYNHLGPQALDLWRFDGWGPPGRGGIYFYNDGRAATPFGDTRPDYGRPEVRRFLRDNARMWLEEYGVDGLRFDATAYIRNVEGRDGDPDRDLPEGWSLMAEINSELHRRWPSTFTVAEDLKGNGWLTRPGPEGGAGFDAQWDGGFVGAVRAALTAVEDGHRDVGAVAAAIGGRHDGDPFQRVVYTESHDEVANGRVRLPEAICPWDAASWYAKKRSTLGAALVLTAPGVPMLFQGQELLEDDWFHDQDPVDWSKRDRFAGILLLYRDLIRLRRNLDGVSGGLCGPHVSCFHVNGRDKVVAFHRWDRGGPGDDVVVVANFANRGYLAYTIGLPAGGRWRVRFNSDWQGYDPSFEGWCSLDLDARPARRDGLGWEGEVGLGPYTAVILGR